MGDRARFISRLLLVFGLLAAATLAVGYWLHTHLLREWKADRQADLDTISVARAAQLSTWRAERVSDALVNARTLAAGGEPVAGALEHLRTGYGYRSVFLVDRYGAIKARAGSPETPPLRLAELLSAIEGTPDRAHFSNVYFATGKTLVALAAAVPHSASSLIFEISFDQMLIPLLQLPTGYSSRTECVLVAHEGRSLTIAAPTGQLLRWSDIDLPLAAQNVLSPGLHAGRMGVASGLDQRGAQVIGSLRRVADSPWYVLTTADLTEVATVWGLRPLMIALILVGCIAGAAAVVGYIWLRQKTSYYKRLYAAERERAALAEHYESLNRLAGEAILLIDPDQRIVEANERAQQLYGYSAGEFRALRLKDIVAGNRDGGVLPCVNSADDGCRCECEQKRKDGSVLIAEASLRKIQTNGGAFIQCIVRDITEQKQQEKTILALNRLYDLAARLNHRIVRATTRQELFESVCESAVGDGGMSMCSILMTEHTTAGSFARMAAARGVPAEMISTLRFHLSGPAETRSVATRAIESGALLVVNDIHVADHVPAGRDLARMLGYGAVAAVPLRQDGTVIGALVLAAVEAGFFQDRECRLLEMMGADLSFALDAFRLEEERRAAAAALKASEELFHRVADTVPAMIWMCDPGGSTTYLNKRVSDFTGRRPEQDLGHGWFELIHRDDADRVTGLFRESIARRTRYTAEFRLRRMDGSYRWVLDHGTPQFGPSGDFTGFIGSCMDITDRLEQEAALRVTEERQRIALDAAQAGTWELDLSTEQMSGDTRFLSVLGFDPDAQPTAADFRERCHPDDGDRLRSFYQSLTASGDREGEYRVLHPDGSIRWVLMRGRAVRDGLGTPARAVGIAIDITSRVRTVERLQKAESVFRRIASTSHEGICEFDGSGHIVFASPRMSALAGWAEAELEGMPADLLFSSASGDRPHELVAECRRAGVSRHCEMQLHRRDGDPAWVSVWLSPLSAEDGSSDRVLAMVADVTARKRLEEQLLQTSKMEALGQLAGGVAHDFNNLLTVILGYAQVAMRNAELPSATREHLRHIVRATERGAGLTRQLLLFGRKHVLQPEHLDLNAVVADLGPMLARLLGERISVRTLYAADLPHVYADRGQLEQVIVNLVVNARDAMPEGGSIEIETSATATLDSRSVCLRVSDSGIGMDDETRAHIFEPFFTTKQKGCGTGLGLATVYGIVSQASGTIQVTSEPGQGATFEIALPASDMPVETAVEPIRPDAVTVSPGSETVLVVEDDPALRLLIDEALSDCGYKVLLASDGAEAIRTAASYPGPIEVLLSDVILPDVCGPDLATAVGAFRRNVATVLMSGYTGRTDVDGAVAKGAAFVPKPFTVEKLTGAIRDVLAKSGRKRIVVADDDPAVREVLRLVLGEAGYEVTEVSNGLELARRIESEQFDLIITDILMPERDGLETLMALRKKSRSARVIVLSGGATAYLKAAQQMGAVEALGKPVSPARLLEAVDRGLRVETANATVS